MNLTFRQYYWRWLKNLSFLFLFFVILTTLARLSFALYFGDIATLLADTNDFKHAFFLGFRFDLMPLAYINAIPFILLNLAYLIPGKRVIKSTRFLLISFLCLGYIALGWLYVFDYGFYSYFQDHLNILVFGFFEDDTKALLISIYKNYNLLLWLTLLFFLHYGLYRLVKFLFSPFDFDVKPRRFSIRMPITFLIGLTLLVFMARGNFTRLPLSVEDAHISQNEFINEVALNGALTLNRAIKIRKTFGKGEFDYLKNYQFNSWEEAFSAYQGFFPKTRNLRSAITAKTKENPFLENNPPHVILVVMESFGSYWNDIHSKDFQILGDLKKHFDRGTLFKNILPSENGTIGSIVSVATSQTIRPGARFLSESGYMKIPLASSGHIAFKENRYDTHFVYGGKLGWRDLGKFLAVQKYDYLWGAEEIKEAMPELNNFSSKDLGNEWGIYDEYLYTFIDEQIRTAIKPQMFLVLTTSNHPPFEYPSSYQPPPLTIRSDLLNVLTVNQDLAIKRFQGFQYANQKIAEFMTRIQTSKAGDNTIVALTGDHSFWIAKGVGLDQEFRRYAVPFFLSIPEKYRPENINTKKFGSHEDIFPTLINLSLSNKSYIKLGEDLFNEESFAINSSGLIANEQGAYHNDRYWKWGDLKKQILVPADPTPELEALKRAGQGQIGLTDSYLRSEKENMQLGEGNGQQ